MNRKMSCLSSKLGYLKHEGKGPDMKYYEVL